MKMLPPPSMNRRRFLPYAVRRGRSAIRDRVHRTDPRLHDDLDLSFQLPHDVSVHFDAELTMPVSARPFATVSATARRVGWGFRTIWVNGREQNLWLRRREVLAHRRTAPANAPPGCQDG